MKKSIVAISCMAFMLLFSSAVFAAATASAQTAPGDQVSITVTNVDATTTAFTFDPSPHVGIAVKITDSAYAINTANSLTGTDKKNGQEYGTKSTSSGYAQRDKTTASGAATANGPKAPTNENTLEGSGWAWMGGS